MVFVSNLICVLWVYILSPAVAGQNSRVEEVPNGTKKGLKPEETTVSDEKTRKIFMQLNHIKIFGLGFVRNQDEYERRN